MENLLDSLVFLKISIFTFPLKTFLLKLPFRWKIGIVATSLSVALTSICVYALYQVTYKAMMAQITRNMLHVGRIGGLMIDSEARAAIKRLKAATERDSIASQADIDAMLPRSTMKSLSAEDINRYHASDDFLILLNILRRLTLATHQDMEPPHDHLPIEEPFKLISSGAFGIYLAVPIKESPNMLVWKYLASAAPFPTADGWPGNPIGNLAKSWEPLDYLLQGKSFVDDRLYADEFYTSLSAAVPLLEPDGSTLAILGIDYAASRERNKLQMLKLFCYGLIGASLVLSGACSLYLAKKLGASLHKLTEAAQQVADNNLNTTVDIRSRDEFAILGEAFNQMVANIRNYTRALEDKQSQLATVILDMHDGVGAILTSIVLNTGKAGNRNTPLPGEQDSRLQAINHLAREGLAEVRFLMNSLEHDVFDSRSLIAEIEMQGADILTPSSIRLTVATSGSMPDHLFSFTEFVDLQRVFREAFVNIVKHAAAGTCEVIIGFAEKHMTIVIGDDGRNFTPPDYSGGRGLKSMQARITRQGGSFSWNWDSGFRIEISLPLERQSA